MTRLTRRDRWLRLPEARLESAGSKEDVCHVCLRGVLDASHKWTWLACEPCRRIDEQIAALLGGRQFLPLGRHSIMNGASVAIDAAPVARDAQTQGLVVAVASWKSLGDWASQEAQRLARAGNFPEAGSIRWSEWSTSHPASGSASRDSYRRLIETHYAWLLQLDPEIARCLSSADE